LTATRYPPTVFTRWMHYYQSIL